MKTGHTNFPVTLKLGDGSQADAKHFERAVISVTKMDVRLLGLWVRIPLGGMDICLLWMLNVVG